MKVLDRVPFALAVLLALSFSIASGSAIARGNSGSHGGGAHFGGSHGSHFSGGHRGIHFSRGHFFGFHSRARIGVFVGAPLLAYGYYPYYDYEPVYSAPLASEYIEKEPESRSPNDYWYYCSGSATYYPYVKECPEGWQAVEPLARPVS